MSHQSLHRLLLLLLVLLVLPGAAQDRGFLRTRGHDMVDENGEKVLLRGVGLGNWLLPEGYMWKFQENGDRPRKIEKIVSDLIGPAEAAQFWRAFRDNYITEADIHRIAELGFNAVRPALNARLFLSEGDSAVFVDEGFELLDRLVAWCKRHGIYVIIDMHGAPGGQTGANIDDSPRDEPELFMDKRNQDRLVALWQKIAARYSEEPIIAAYDLLNEPLPHRSGAAARYQDQLEPLYQRITAAIRAVDRKHMITLEGVDWSNDWSVFSEPFDDNLFYQFHYYCWDRPDLLKDISYFLDKRNQFNTPIWVGETGEKGNTIYWGTTQYFESHNIGWSFWPWKKMDTRNTPYSIQPPDLWHMVIEYTAGKGKHDLMVMAPVFQELLENIKLENCTFYPDVVNAIFRRIPGKVEAENYGHLGYGQSYFVHDTTHRSARYRTGEPVPVQLIKNDKKSRFSEQGIVLKAGEWSSYTISSMKKQAYACNIQIKPERAPVRVSIAVGGQQWHFAIEDRDWQVVSPGVIGFEAGENQVRIQVELGNALIDWLDFAELPQGLF